MGLYRSTHPVRGLGSGLARPGSSPVDRCRTHLFDLPDGVVEGDVPTPDGGTIHYAEKGSRAARWCLLHGVTLRHDVWAPQFHQLADRYRVIAVDLRGHGRSQPGSPSAWACPAWPPTWPPCWTVLEPARRRWWWATPWVA
jgi:hypothetical protein